MSTLDAKKREPFAPSPNLSERQVEVMCCLWERGSATSRELWEATGDEVTYQSVLVTLQSLEEGGFVRHEAAPEGDRVRFHPAVSRDEAEREAIDCLLRRLFRQSPEAMIDALLPRADDSEPEEREPPDRAGPPLESVS